jgi:hypothetical protein
MFNFPIIHTRPNKTADGHGGFTEAYNSENDVVIWADPQINEAKSEIIISADEDVRIGDWLIIPYGEYVDDSGDDTNYMDRYSMTFTNASLSSGKLWVTHSLGKKFVSVTIHNDSGDEITPDQVHPIDTNSIMVNLSSFGNIAGTWNATFRK